MSSDITIDDKWIKKLDRQTQNLIDRIGVDRKTLDEVFDLSTLHVLGKLISDDIIEYLDFPISTGKEANVFRAVTPNKQFLALKIYRTSTSTFKHITKYIIGDPRFRLTSKSRRDIIHAWTKKEYKNLQRLHHAEIRVPKPIYRRDNILLMEYIGNAKNAAPLLKNIYPKEPTKICNELISFVKTMYQKAELIHGDLSPYNILFYRQKPYIIDVGQAVLHDHHLAEELLVRDIHNLISFFSNWDIHLNHKKILKEIKKTPVKK